MFSIAMGMHRDYKTGKSPLSALSIESLSALVKAGYADFTKGKFEECHVTFLKVLHSIPFVVCETKPQLNELKKLLGICREYVLGLVLEAKRKVTEDKVRQCELAAYFTHCHLEPMHLCLVLRQAMSMNVKLKSFGIAASFARRLLELNPSAKFAQDAHKVLAAAQATPTNATALNYDERNPFVVSGETFKPLYRGTVVTKSGYCLTSYENEHKGGVCGVCQIGEIGADVSGLQCTSAL